MPPPSLGSGKFGTPCERMHREYAKKPDLPLAVWLELVPDVPQAAIANALPVIATINRRRGGEAKPRIAYTSAVDSPPLITPS